MRKLLSILTVLICLAASPALALEIIPGSLAAPHGGNYVQADGWIYYNVQTQDDSHCLFRMRLDGTVAEKLVPAYIIDLCVDGDTLYFFDNTQPPGGIMRYTVGGEKENIYPAFSTDVQVVDGEILCLSDDFYMETRITTIPTDAPAITQGDDGAFYYEGDMAAYDREVDSPFRLLWHGGWLYYTGYTGDGGHKLGRIRPDGGGGVILATDADGFDEDASFIGTEGDTLYLSSYGHYSGGFVASYSEAGGFALLDGAPQSFAYRDGYFYYSDQTQPAVYPMEARTGVFRRTMDGVEEVLTDADVTTPMYLSGGWVFAQMGGGLNAEPVMLPAGGGAVQTVPGFGAYDYEANRPVDDTPRIEWRHETYGGGSVELVLRAYERPAAFRLLSTDEALDGAPLFAVAEPYTLVTFRFSPGTYILKVAEGERWIDDENAFGPTGTYSTTQEYVFEAGYSYEITTGTRGDFYTDNAGGFMN